MHDRKNIHHGHFYFDPQDPIYKDHFPGYPVVPGSLVVSAFLKAVQAQEGRTMTRIRNFRFRRFISPGRYAYRIEQSKVGDMAHLVCTLYDEETRLVTGTLL